MDTSNFWDSFVLSIKCIFSRWTALCLAIENSWGGISQTYLVLRNNIKQGVTSTNKAEFLLGKVLDKFTSRCELDSQIVDISKNGYKTINVFIQMSLKTSFMIFWRMNFLR